MSLSLPKISIVVPNFNGGTTIAATLESLIEQHYPDLELIVVDGGSTDESVAVIRRFEPYLAWWVSEKDQGQSNAINKGLARATGDVVNWLCSDDRLAPGALLRVGGIFAENPDVDVVTGSAQAAWHTGGWSKVLTPTMERIELMPCAIPIQQPSTFYRRRLLKRTPVIDESFTYTMDLELWMYFKAQGARWHCVEDVLSVFVHSPGNKTTVGGSRIRKEMARVYRRYVHERIPLTVWQALVFLPLDHVRKWTPEPWGEKIMRPVRVFAERVLGKFYGFTRIHVMDWSWTIQSPRNRPAAVPPAPAGGQSATTQAKIGTSTTHE